MKKMRRIVSFVLAMVMVMGMSMTAMAATITIENPVKGRTYKVYKIFDVTKNEDATSFAYTIKDDNEWYEKVSEMASGLNIQLEAIAGTANPVIYNVKRKADFNETTFAKTFAEKLNTELQKTDFNPTETGTGTGPESGDLTITVTDPGYYFVDSSLGSLCFLNTTDATKAISEKNSLPSVGIKVEDEDKTEADKWSDTATADITEKVKFKVTANTGSNSKADPTATGVDKDYVITVTLPAGLTYETSTEYQLKVYTVTGSENVWILNTDYTVTQPSESKELVIILKGDGKLKDLVQNTNVFVEYYATVNSNATIASGGNASTVKISYDDYEVPATTGDPARTATVYTYQIDVLKYTTAGTTEKTLANAKFKLYREENSVKKYAQVLDEKLKGWTATESDGFEFTTLDDGKFSLKGLDQGTYYLVETDAPDGYNQLKDRIEVKITAQADNSATVTYKMPDDNNYATANTEIKVLNETGLILPSTGGMGTTLFYIVGGVMVAVAVVLLVTRKRMGEQE